MKTCCFFGHRDCPATIAPKLSEAIIKLIILDSVDTFLVGNQGNFDCLVIETLMKLGKEYDIKYNIALAYMPTDNQTEQPTILPEGIEEVPKRFAIPYRNKWMIMRSEYVITYIKHNFGGAAQYAELAQKKGKTCINIANYQGKFIKSPVLYLKSDDKRNQTLRKFHIF